MHTHIPAADGSPEAALVVGDFSGDTLALLPVSAPCEHQPDTVAMIATEDCDDGESVMVALTRIDLIALRDKAEAILEGRFQ